MSLGLPLVIALNKMDEARAQGLYLSSNALARRLGVPVVPTSAARGYGLVQLFRAALDAARKAALHRQRLLREASQAERHQHVGFGPTCASNVLPR